MNPLCLICLQRCCGLSSKSTHSPNEFFNFLYALSLMTGCQKEQNDTCDLGTIIIYLDNFFCYLQIFLFQPIIEIAITLKSLYINGPHPIRYIEVQIIENLNRSVLIGLSFIRQYVTHDYSYINPKLDEGSNKIGLKIQQFFLYL